MSEKKDVRSCFNCTQFDMCFIRHNVENAISGVKLNLDGNSTPGVWADIFMALANCCSKYFELIDVLFEK